MTDLTSILVLLIALASVCIGTFAIPWFKSKTAAEQRANLLQWVDIAVAAAQQLFHQADGETRLNHALSILQEKGFNIDTIEVRNAVEAAVLKLHQQLKEASYGV